MLHSQARLPSRHVMRIPGGFECGVFALSHSEGRVCVAGVRSEEAARGRLPAEDGRIVRVCALHSQPSQGLITSRHPIIPRNNTVKLYTHYTGADRFTPLPPPPFPGLFSSAHSEQKKVNRHLELQFIFQQLEQ